MLLSKLRFVVGLHFFLIVPKSFEFKRYFPPMEATIGRPALYRSVVIETHGGAHIHPDPERRATATSFIVDCTAFVAPPI